ncbi:MAG: hypothetical protein KI785_14650, partial [Devosiaceae bacterium]|nr:hypothetical protein [Devosiaceae bacterium MH13]
RDALTGDPEKLADVPAVVQDLPGFRDRWQLSGRDVAVPITPAVKVSSALAARGAAVAGVGPALLADWLAAPVVEARQLACLYPDLSFDVAASAPAAWLVRPASVPETAKVAAVAHFLRENLRGSGTFTGD